jgi:hypothetical protein
MVQGIISLFAWRNWGRQGNCSASPTSKVRFKAAILTHKTAALSQMYVCSMKGGLFTLFHDCQRKTLLAICLHHCQLIFIE